MSQPWWSVSSATSIPLSAWSPTKALLINSTKDHQTILCWPGSLRSWSSWTTRARPFRIVVLGRPILPSIWRTLLRYACRIVRSCPGIAQKTTLKAFWSLSSPRRTTRMPDKLLFAWSNTSTGSSKLSPPGAFRWACTICGAWMQLWLVDTERLAANSLTSKQTKKTQKAVRSRVVFSDMCRATAQL
ncbi:hypothetical protein PTTG_29553 [Puccinia triticina 1-1 BBBD Race 1]|uniref:Uncharacterized protein n=1 Tax=Puccinia triticina (isolate 1-1 / race 1 (BBBD)) TaxID=630390 RepID=A0A180G3X7_PUCT1|nr:hypothetical protein PTTG_29553 [Puccinia triticina 1-1 BBBD Race 1]